MSPELIIYDFDSTIFDSIEAGLHMISAFNESEGLQLSITLETLKHLNSDEAPKEVTKKFWELGERLETERFIYPNFYKTVRQIKDQGILIAIVSNTARERIERILGNENIQLFDMILGGQDVSETKPSSVPYATVIEMLNVLASNVIVVGNSMDDFIPAQKCNCNFVFFLPDVNVGQFPDEVELKSFVGDKIIKDHSEILGMTLS